MTDNIQPPRASEVTKKLNIWKDRLQDLSGRNSLLYFHPNRTSTLEIFHPDLPHIFEQLVTKARVLEIPIPKPRVTEPKEADQVFLPEYKYAPHELGVKQPIKQLSRILYNLRSRTRTAQEEQGINILYLVMGFLQWFDAVNSEPAKAPLVLVPISLERTSADQPYTIQIFEDDIVLNPSLVVKLRNDFRIELPDLPELNSYLELEAYFQKIYSVVSGFGNWKVNPEAAIGTFNFQNLIIIQDLEKNEAFFTNHPLIQAISAGKYETPKIDVLEASELDDKVIPADTFQVLLSDSSQQEAIEAAKRGVNLIIQGPPGTGKSQTITNLIAEFLGQEKKVLFVSQKAEALEVVKSRLEEVELDEFCLMIHSHRRNKVDVIQELGAALDKGAAARLEQAPSFIAELATTRRRLNEYVRILHTRALKLETTPFELYGWLAKLEATRELRFSIPNIKAVTKAEQNQWVAVIRKFQEFETFIQKQEKAIWYGVPLTEISLALSEKLEDSFAQLKNIIQSLDGYAEELALVYGIEPVGTLLEIGNLLRVARKFSPEILKDPKLPEIYQQFSDMYRNGLRYLRPSYWQARKIIQQYAKQKKLPGYQVLLEDLSYAARWWNNKLVEPKQLEEGEIETTLAQLNHFSQMAQEIQKMFKDISSNLGTPQEGQEYLEHFVQTPINELVNTLQLRYENIGELETWARFNKLVQECKKLQLDDFTKQASENRIPVLEWPDVFIKRLYVLALDAITLENEILHEFSGHSHENIIKTFRELDETRIRFARQQISQKIRNSRPDASWMKTTSTETAILRREMNKKRRIKPLRRLFAEIPDLLLNLKPCLMMSPYTVSQLLSPELFHFDVVLFDEASQIPSEYAVAGITRATQVIIAGDTKQLPPTRFFQTMEVTSEDEDEIYDEFESILNEADAIGMPQKLLKWHYRSRDEALIAFSNYQFYGNKLYTFPNSNTSNAQTGIQFKFIPNGIYRRGPGGQDNLIEAREVVQGIIEHFSTHPEKSLGVVTFSQAQKRAIEEVLDQTLLLNRHLQTYFATDSPNPFFVKNLESVQGDERDYIFFSIGYGKDESGKFLMNFGPLNRSGGERRLNVAVTRARYGVRVYASIQPEDIDLDKTESQGARLLRSYLEVARDGTKAVYRDTRVHPDLGFESPFEQSVYEALTRAGLEVKSQIGVSEYRIDLAVIDPKQPGRYLLGIECDGAMYHSAATARDRDRLRQLVLEGLGWKMHRIWSRDWFKDSKVEIKKVFNRLAAIENGYILSLPKEKAGIILKKDHQINPHDLNLVKFDGSNKPKETTSYRMARIASFGSGASDFWSASGSQIQRILTQVVEVEGPVSNSLALKRVTEAWRIQRVTQKIEQKILSEIAFATSKGLFIQKGDFLWPKGLDTVNVRTPIPGEYRRSIEEIPLEEIAEAAFICVQTALSLESDHLLQETAAIFDLKVTPNSRDRLTFGIKLLVQDGRITWRENKIRLPQSR